MDIGTVIKNLSDDELFELSNDIDHNRLIREKSNKIRELCIKNSYNGTVTEMGLIMAELNVMYECASRWRKLMTNKII